MSYSSKDGKSLTSVPVLESGETQQGFKKLKFYHQAVAGETFIDLTNLTVPSGNTNPTTDQLADAKLFRYKENLTLISSSKNTLMQGVGLSYRVSSGTRISLNFATEEGEIFEGTLDANPIQLQGLESKTPVVNGDLLDGNTDFAIGFSTKTLTDEILVFRNGLEQKRNPNNSSTVTGDGNYYVVDSGSGFGSVVRFNVAASGNDDYIKVTAIGGVVTSPTDSVFDEIEKLQGQIDAIVPDLADALDNPETKYQGTPNNVDLKQFGAIVTGLYDIKIPYQNETTLVATGSGDFTGGAIKITRVGTQVTIQTETALTFASLATAQSAVGFIPSWAIPDISRWNLYINNGSNYIARARVSDTGLLEVDFSNFSGADTVQITDNAFMSISYAVVDNESKTIQEILEDKGIL